VCVAGQQATTRTSSYEVDRSPGEWDWAGCGDKFIVAAVVEICGARSGCSVAIARSVRRVDGCVLHLDDKKEVVRGNRDCGPRRCSDSEGLRIRGRIGSSRIMGVNHPT